MDPTALAVPLERRIWVIRGRRIMLDYDLAEIYGVSTKRLNEQVKRNPDRFPQDFMLRLTRAETRLLGRLRSQFATLKKGKHIKYLPFAFTEHGAVMLASVLNSPVAVTASIQVVRAFVRLREMISERDGLGRKVADLERRVGTNSKDIGRIFDVIEEIVESPGPSKAKKIGFAP